MRILGARLHDIQDGILNLDEEEKIYNFSKIEAFLELGITHGGT